jgi:hypothetical protein
MVQYRVCSALASLFLAVVIFASPAPADAATTAPLAGTWSLVALKSGTNEPYGANPRGAMLLAPDGHFSITILRESIAKLASNNRTTGTDAENKAVVQGSIGFYGTYAVNEKDQTVEMQTVASTFPNAEGTKQARPYVLSGDELTLTSLAPSGGGGATVQVWKRVR